MLNRATTTLHDEDKGNGLLGLTWQVDQYPLVRLALLGEAGLSFRSTL